MVREFFQNIARAWKMASTIDILAALYAQSNSKSGAVVNWKTALEATTSTACARVIAEGIAQIPCRVFKTDGVNRVPAEDAPLYHLLHDSPNEWMTSYEYREMIGLHLVFCGNHFSFINRYRGGVYELLPYEPQQVTVRRDGWKIEYEVDGVDGRKIPVPAANMWHIRGPSWNGWMGLEGVKMAREAIGLAMAAEESGAALFRNGSQPSGLLSTDNLQMSKEKAKELRESWEVSNAGTNRLKTAVLWGGMKWTPMSYQNDQMQFNETRKFQVEEICRAFRVMPIMVGYSDKTATYASAEQMFIAHVVHTMGPWYQRIEQSANMNLLSEEERKAGLYVKFIVNGLMRGAAKDRAEYYAKALGAGGSPAFMTQDEVRELEELNPKGGKADELREPSNVGTPANPDKPNETPAEEGNTDEKI